MIRMVILIDYDPSDAANAVADRPRCWYRLLLSAGSWATGIRLKTITFCWLMLADIKHHKTTATVLTVGLRDFVLLKIKVGILNGEKGTESRTQRVSQLKNYVILSGDDLSDPQRGEHTTLGQVSMCWPCTTAQQAAKQHTHVCLQTKPERFHFRVTVCSGVPINFFKFWGFYKICSSWLKASRFPKMICWSTNKLDPQELLSSYWLLRGSNTYKMTTKS